MQALLLKYGYLLLFFGVAVEGETFLLAGAFLAHLGYFHLSYVILVALAGNCFADQIYYFVAASRGKRWLDQRFGKSPRYQKLLDRMSRHGNWLLLASRYLYGFRILVPAACGALGMSPATFTIFNILAGLIWAVPTALLGYYFSAPVEALFQHLHHYQALILIVALLAAVVYLSLRYLRRLAVFQDFKFSDLHGIVPYLIGAMGLVNLISALLPRAHPKMALLESWLPLEVSQRSRPLMLFAGLALLQVMQGLQRRKELAWYVATLSLAVSFLLHITRAFDLHHSLISGMLLAYLIYFRRRFYARSDPSSLQLGVTMAPLLIGLVMLYGALGLSHLKSHFQWGPGATPISEAFRAGVLIVDPNLEPLDNYAARFLGSVEIAGWLSRFYLLLLFLRPVILRDRQEAPPEKLRKIFAKESQNSLSNFALQPDKHHLLLAGGEAFVAYSTRGAVAITCGDPLAPPEKFASSVAEFMKYGRKNAWTPCFYEAAEEFLPIYQKLGLRSIKIAEEAVVDLREFSLAGGRRATLRAMVNKVTKLGPKVWRYDRKHHPDPFLDEQLEQISEEWLEEKHLSELGFTIGRFSLEALDEVYVFLCGTKEKIEAFSSWLPFRQGKAACLDLMRRRQSAVSGTMDYLLAHALLQLRDAGLETASLASAPLANVDRPHGPLERGVSLLFENMNAFYGYKNLFQFKNKFAPRWEGRYLVYPRGADLPRIAYALARVHSQGGLLDLFSSLLTN